MAILGSALLWIGILSKPLGIPSPWDSLPLVAGVLCFYFAFRYAKRLKPNREVTIAPDAIRRAGKIKFWSLSASLIFGSMIIMPLLPYTVDNFQPWIYYYVIPCQILVVGGFIFYMYRKLLGKAAALEKKI